MEINQLKEFFHLAENPELFTTAISPPSCGGGDSFRSLALEGDKILDSAIISLLQQNGLLNSGEITRKKQQFHNERTLGLLGTEFLELQKFLRPIDVKYRIQNSDIKESIEALIAACKHQNEEAICFQVIKELFEISMENEYLDFDFISELQMLLQKELNNPLLQWSFPIRIGGPEHAPIWTIRLKVQYNKNTYEIMSKPFSNLKYAKRDAAKKILQKLLNTSFPSSKQIIIPQKHVESKSAAQSISQHQIIFSKVENTGNKESAMNISVGTGKLLIDWVKEKISKNPYGTLLILSSILPQEIKGSSWNASTEVGELCLLNLQIEKNFYFEIGFGSSKSQARKDAVIKIIDSSHLFEWLSQKHADTLK